MGETQQQTIARWVTIVLTAGSVIWAVAVTVVANTREGASITQRVAAHEERIKVIEQRVAADHDILIELRMTSRRIEDRLEDMQNKGTP